MSIPQLPSREELLAKRPALLAKIDACSSVQEAEPFIHQLDLLDEMIEQVSPRRVGLVDTPPPRPKPMPSEIIPPQPKPINYQDQHDKCKACGLVGTGDSPLMVVKMITAQDGGSAFVSEHYVHTGCIGVLVITRPRSLFQIKLKED